MNKRESLSLILCCEENGDDSCGGKCIHPENASFCPYGFVVDKLLDELMSPGEEALGAPRKRGQIGPVGAKEVWQAIITAIKAGK